MYEKKDIFKIYKNIQCLIEEKDIIIVGIDGLGGAGKSTISIELSELLSRNQVHNLLFHIDDFIHPKAIRYNENYAEWECYYNIQWRYDYFIQEVIEPIKSKRENSIDIELYDKDHDSYFITKEYLKDKSVVIVEGIFLQREELKNTFDFMIYVDVPEKIRLDRVLSRDHYIGDEEQIISKYENRYFPAERRYVEKCQPNIQADYVIK